MGQAKLIDQESIPIQEQQLETLLETAGPEFDVEVKIFDGEVAGTRDVITFQGASLEELEVAFRESIDD